MKKINERDFVSAKPHATLSSGEVITMLRELKGWTQAELAKRSGINSSNLSLLENDRIEIGKKRVEQLFSLEHMTREYVALYKKMK